MFEAMRSVRWWSPASLVGLTLLVLLAPPVPSPAQSPDRARQIAELEKELEALKQKLAALKAAEPPPALKPIQLADTLTWRRARGATLSRDGQWFAYRVGPAEGNSEVVLRQARGDKEHKFPAGGPGFGQLAFSHDSKWLAFSHAPPGPGAARPRGPGAPAAQAATPGKITLVNLATLAKTEYEGARRFAFSGEASAFLALQRASTPPPAAPAPAARSGGTDLILRELATGKELTLGNVSELAFDKAGRWLALLVETRDQAGNGVQLRNMKTGALHQLESGKASYRSLSWTEKGDGFTVLKGTEAKVSKDKRYSVLGFTDLSAPAPKVIAYDPRNDPHFPKGMTLSANRAPFFAEDLGAIFFGIQKIAKADKATKGDGPGKGRRRKGGAEEGALAAAPPSLDKGKSKEKPDVVIWHWLDKRLQSEQQVQAGFDRSFSHLGLYRIADKKFVRLADDDARQVMVAPHHRWAVALDNGPYQRGGGLSGQRFQDVYVIDLQTGKRRLALKKNRWFFGTSPKGAHFLYYDEGHFFTHELATGKSHCLTATAPISFVDSENDHNVVRPPTRPVGWAKDDSAVLLSDNWDVWKFPAHGGSGVNLTGDGKKEGVRYRFRIPLDPDEKGIDLSAPIYFSRFGEWTKKSGFARVMPGQPGAVCLVWDDAEYRSLMKARGGDVFVFTRETYKDAPDYHLCDATFKGARKLTHINPEQSRYLWSSGVKLLDYKSTKGDKLQAALLLPAGYEKGKTYPTIVYIYERLSGRLNAYNVPTAGGFNPAVYTSNGYAVLMPDIRYRVNDPGMSAVWCVLPALEAAVRSGVVDKQRVGLHGHSWGGYQTSFLITQTDAFKAAAAGAPLTNLISMYSLIYWNTGWTNQPIFESSQGRFRGGYWDDLDAYVRNSPVFHARNVKTPLLLLHNDKDGAVDWTQGIEYFNTLRRLDKPVVMLQYKGENHGLVKPANRKDYTVRMQEFFDHHLRGKPAPAWLKKGVPHLEMDEHLEERGKGR